MNRIVEVAADPQALAQRMAGRWCEYSAEVLRSKDRFQVALSGGSTPRTLYQALASPPWRGRLGLSRHQWVFCDGRGVAPPHPGLQLGLGSVALFRPPPPPPPPRHRPPGPDP